MSDPGAGAGAGARAGAGAGAGAGGRAELTGGSTGIAVVVQAVLKRPDLWLVALRQGLLLGRAGWWRKWPPIPEPTDSLWHLRMLTAYGGDGSEPPRPVDVVSYLEWCQGSRQWRRG
ncbi:MAG: hypothetical protein WAM97_02590 [Acidimicrobiales bacterium]